MADESPSSEARKARYRAVRSILETPILDSHKWAKLAGIPADMAFLDLEDSVPPARKVEARAKVVAALANNELGSKLALARPNHLSTPWGHDDVVAMAEAGVDCLAYPKIVSPADLEELIGLLDRHGARPAIYAIIETAASVVFLRELASMDGVVALMSGPGDLSVDIGMPLYEPDGTLNHGFLFTKMQTVITGAAFGLATVDIAYGPDLRDLPEIRRRVEQSRRLGFTTMSTFYPPHVDIINDVFSPGPEELDKARSVVDVFEQVLRDGRPAALTETGETILVHDYEKARHLLAKAGR
jgi:citrate lyase beta subunit